MITEFNNIVLLAFSFFLDNVLSVPIRDLDHAEGVMVRTVSGGSTVVLKCTSNDPRHNFQYWHLVDSGVIIGPANHYDPGKFKFEVLSGNLTIRGVSKKEEGLYECVSRAVHGEDMSIKLVRMIVQEHYVEVYETDYHINLIRILIALITVVLLSMAAWFAYRIWKDRYRYPRYLATEDEDDDDESTEELFSQQPSTSKPPSLNSHIVPGNKNKKKETTFNDVDISTDFKSILDTANDK